MKNKKMKIGIDIDEVVVEFFKEYLKLFNERFEKNLVLDDILKFEIWEFTDVSKEDALSLAEEFNSSDNFFKMNFVDDSKESLFKINENFDIHFITSRPENLNEKTKIFLKSHFKEMDFDLHFSGGVWNDRKSKSQICKELEIPVLIEDRRKYALECAQEGIKVLLLDKSWNQNCEHENIICVKDWNEIMKEIEDIKNAN